MIQGTMNTLKNVLSSVTSYGLVSKTLCLICSENSMDFVCPFGKCGCVCCLRCFVRYLNISEVPCCLKCKVEYKLEILFLLFGGDFLWTIYRRWMIRKLSYENMGLFSKVSELVGVVEKIERLGGVGKDGDKLFVEFVTPVVDYEFYDELMLLIVDKTEIVCDDEIVVAKNVCAIEVCSEDEKGKGKGKGKGKKVKKCTTCGESRIYCDCDKCKCLVCFKKKFGKARYDKNMVNAMCRNNIDVLFGDFSENVNYNVIFGKFKEFVKVGYYSCVGEKLSFLQNQKKELRKKLKIDCGEVVNVRICFKCKAVMDNFCCKVCNIKLCAQCEEQIIEDREHVCNGDDVKSLELIRRDSKNCPQCKVVIYRSGGCRDMFCVGCNVYFNWETGTILMRNNIHNPHAKKADVDKIEMASQVISLNKLTAKLLKIGVDACVVDDVKRFYNFLVNMNDRIMLNYIGEDGDIIDLIVDVKMGKVSDVVYREKLFGNFIDKYFNSCMLSVCQWVIVKFTEIFNEMGLVCDNGVRRIDDYFNVWCCTNFKENIEKCVSFDDVNRVWEMCREIKLKIENGGDIKKGVKKLKCDSDEESPKKVSAKKGKKKDDSEDDDYPKKKAYPKKSEEYVNDDNLSSSSSIGNKIKINNFVNEFEMNRKVIVDDCVKSINICVSSFEECFNLMCIRFEIIAWIFGRGVRFRNIENYNDFSEREIKEICDLKKDYLKTNCGNEMLMGLINIVNNDNFNFNIFFEKFGCKFCCKYNFIGEKWKSLFKTDVVKEIENKGKSKGKSKK